MLYSSTNRNRMTIVGAYIHIRGVIAILPMAEGGLAKVPLMFFFCRKSIIYLLFKKLRNKNHLCLQKQSWNWLCPFKTVLKKITRMRKSIGQIPQNEIQCIFKVIFPIHSPLAPNCTWTDISIVFQNNLVETHHQFPREAILLAERTLAGSDGGLRHFSLSLTLFLKDSLVFLIISDILWLFCGFSETIHPLHVANFSAGSCFSLQSKFQKVPF